MTVIMRKSAEGTAVLVEHIDRGGWSMAGAAVGHAANETYVVLHELDHDSYGRGASPAPGAIGSVRVPRGRR